MSFVTIGPGLIIAIGEFFALVGAALIVTIATYAAWLYVRRYGPDGRQRGDRCREVMSQWADRRGFHFDPEALRIDGAAASVEILVTATYDQIEWSLPPALSISAISTEPRPVVAQVATSWFSLEDQIAHHRTSLGDAEFDAKYRTWCDPPDAARAVIDETCRMLIASLEPDEVLYDRGVVEVRWEEDFLESTERAFDRLDVAADLLLRLC